MSRTFSTNFSEAITAQATSEVPLVLLTLDHETFTSPVRVVNNTVAISSNGNVFQPYPFEVEFPSETDRIQEARVRIDNVNRLVIEKVRTIQSPAEATFQIVLASDPDTIEQEYGPLQVLNADISLQTVTFSIGAEPVAYEQFPPARYTPQVAPGLF